MKVLKESLLLNDLESVLDVCEEEILIMRSEKEPVVLLTLSKYNELKEQVYKQKKNG